MSLEALYKKFYRHLYKKHPTIEEKVKEYFRNLESPYQQIEIQVEPGVVKCKKCESNRVISRTVQTRSGDEEATVFHVCQNCGNRWVQG